MSEEQISFVTLKDARITDRRGEQTSLMVLLRDGNGAEDSWPVDLRSTDITIINSMDGGPDKICIPPWVAGKLEQHVRAEAGMPNLKLVTE